MPTGNNSPQQGEQLKNILKNVLKDIKEAIEKPHWIQYITLIAVVASLAISMRAYSLAELELQPFLLHTDVECPNEFDYTLYSNFINFDIINYGTTTQYSVNLTTNGLKCSYDTNSYSSSDYNKYNETSCFVYYNIGKNSNAHLIFLLIVNKSKPDEVWFNLDYSYNKLYGQTKKTNMLYCRYNRIKDKNNYDIYQLIESR